MSPHPSTTAELLLPPHSELRMLPSQQWSYCLPPHSLCPVLSADTAPSHSSDPPLPSCLGPLCLRLSRSCSDISFPVRPSLIPSFKVTHTQTPVACTLPVAFSSFIFLHSI